MSERVVCPRCRRPAVVCYCAHATPVETRTRVLFLQHPRERDVPIGTVRIARLCLPNSELRVGVDFADDAVVQHELTRPERPAVLLFPGPDARDLREHAPEGPVTLVVVDGTWSLAAKLIKQNPFLRALPQYRLTPARPSNYRIRREPAEHCVATIEALAEVLAVLEGDPERTDALLAPFEAMVRFQLEYAARGDGRRARQQRPKRAPRPRPIPDELHARAGSLVFAYGEANAYPFDAVDAPRPEIVHWVARRFATGETFDAVVAPRAELAPSIAYHTRLPREQILGGESFEAFRARWQAFLREGDVLCTWGSYSADVLAAQGVEHPPRLDLRSATGLYLGERPGEIHACAERLGATVAQPAREGRAPQRLAALVAIAEALAQRAQPV